MCSTHNLPMSSEQAPRRYYSLRTHAEPALSRLDLSQVRPLFSALFADFQDRGYFIEALGSACVDSGWEPGTFGNDPGRYVMRILRKPNVWPVPEKVDTYAESDLFDIIEFLYDHVSAPVVTDDTYFHPWGDCGYHYDVFDKAAEQRAFRDEVNALLRDYQDGYEISPEGEICFLGDLGLDTLLSASLPSIDVENVDARVEAAVTKFRRRGASLDERHDAVRTLADVLERLRPQFKGVLNHKDEADLFEIANRFGVRHNDAKQQTNYERPLWLSWMFYYYLATIHLAVRRIKLAAGAGTA